MSIHNDMGNRIPGEGMSPSMRPIDEKGKQKEGVFSIDSDGEQEAQSAACSIGADVSLFEAKIAPDMLYHILSFLDPKDLSVCARVSGHMHSWTLYCANQSQYEKMRDFIRWLHGRLDNGKVKQDLECILSSLSKSQFPNFLSLKKDFIIVVKNQIIDALSNLSSGQLNVLQSEVVNGKVEGMPFFCENMFTVAEIWGKALKINWIEEQDHVNIFNIYSGLMKAGDYERTIKFVKDMPPGKYDAYEPLSIKILGFSFYEGIVKGLITAGKFDRAIELVRELPDEIQKNDRLYEKISLGFLRIGKLDRAIEMANHIEVGIPFNFFEGEKSFESFAWNSIVIEFDRLIEAKEFDVAIERAADVFDPYLKNLLNNKILNALLQAGEFDLAIALAKSDLDKWTFDKIFEAFAQAGMVEQAIEVASGIADLGKRQSAEIAMCAELLRLKGKDAAFEFADRCSSESKDLLFAKLSVAFFEEKDNDGAKEALNRIDDDMLRGQLLQAYPQIDYLF